MKVSETSEFDFIIPEEFIQMYVIYVLCPMIVFLLNYMKKLCIAIQTEDISIY